MFTLREERTRAGEQALVRFTMANESPKKMSVMSILQARAEAEAGSGSDEDDWDDYSDDEDQQFYPRPAEEKKPKKKTGWFSRSSKSSKSSARSVSIEVPVVPFPQSLSTFSSKSKFKLLAFGQFVSEVNDQRCRILNSRRDKGTFSYNSEQQAVKNLKDTASAMDMLGLLDSGIAALCSSLAEVDYDAAMRQVADKSLNLEKISQQGLKHKDADVRKLGGFLRICIFASMTSGHVQRIVTLSTDIRDALNLIDTVLDVTNYRKLPPLWDQLLRRLSNFAKQLNDIVQVIKVASGLSSNKEYRAHGALTEKISLNIPKCLKMLDDGLTKTYGGLLGDMESVCSNFRNMEVDRMGIKELKKHMKRHMDIVLEENDYYEVEPIVATNVYVLFCFVMGIISYHASDLVHSIKEVTKHLKIVEDVYPQECPVPQSWLACCFQSVCTHDTVEHSFRDACYEITKLPTSGLLKALGKASFENPKYWAKLTLEIRVLPYEDDDGESSMSD